MNLAQVVIFFNILSIISVFDLFKLKFEHPKIQKWMIESGIDQTFIQDYGIYFIFVFSMLLCIFALICQSYELNTLAKVISSIAMGITTSLMAKIIAHSEEGGNEKINFLYMVFHRIWKPRELLEHGRLTYEQIANEVIKKVTHPEHIDFYQTKFTAIKDGLLQVALEKNQSHSKHEMEIRVKTEFMQFLMDMQIELDHLYHKTASLLSTLGYYSSTQSWGEFIFKSAFLLISSFFIGYGIRSFIYYTGSTPSDIFPGKMTHSQSIDLVSAKNIEQTQQNIILRLDEIEKDFQLYKQRGFIEMSPLNFQLKQVQNTVNVLRIDVDKNKIHMQNLYRDYLKNRSELKTYNDNFIETLVGVKNATKVIITHISTLYPDDYKVWDAAKDAIKNTPI